MWNRSAKINKLNRVRLLLRWEEQEEIEVALAAPWFQPKIVQMKSQPCTLASLAMRWLNLPLVVTDFLADRTCSGECCRK